MNTRSGEADGDLRDCNDGIMAQSNNGNKGIYLAWQARQAAAGLQASEQYNHAYASNPSRHKGPRIFRASGRPRGRGRREGPAGNNIT